MRPHIEPFCDRDVQFKNMRLPGFAPGMGYKMLSFDPETGGNTMSVQLDGGYRQAPGFSWGEREMIVIEGELQVGDRTCRKGHYFFVPAGYALPEVRSDQGCLVLEMHNTGEPSHEESTEHHPQAQVELYHDIDSFMDIPWAMGNVVSPAVASGCLIKLLNYNPISHAMTFLYCMTPGFWQDNISYHDCAEESYHLWGTSWMMQFGDIPTGGYFWRPAYINHGAFASEYGCIALGRTDSKLFNHFHYNPWSNPVENANRSFSRILQRDPQLYKWAFSEDHNHPHSPEDFEKTMQRRGDEEGHDTEHKSDGHRHDHWHGHHHHDHDSPYRHPLDGPDDHHHD
ncbi:MAG: DUF4437 domain-containing protein [Thermoanaerobaculales bacterium]|jgi:hypothetical protein|nr:DUF4437 domain-containing protein [Thermoanaerobaculales bacterium]